MRMSTGRSWAAVVGIRRTTTVLWTRGKIRGPSTTPRHRWRRRLRCRLARKSPTITTTGWPRIYWSPLTDSSSKDTDPRMHYSSHEETERLVNLIVDQVSPPNKTYFDPTSTCMTYGNRIMHEYTRNFSSYRRYVPTAILKLDHYPTKIDASRLSCVTLLLLHFESRSRQIVAKLTAADGAASSFSELFKLIRRYSRLARKW